MRRIVFATVALALLGLTPVAGTAAPMVPETTTAGRPSITLVEGWWEQQHREEEYRDRYWRLPPRERDRYNRLQYQINQLQQQRQQIDAQLNRAQQDQYRLLGYQGQ